MPRAADILDGLSAIANQATGVAAAWHILIGMALVALAERMAPITAHRSSPDRDAARVGRGRRHRICESIQWVGFHRECVGDDCARDARGRRLVSLGFGVDVRHRAGDGCVWVGLPALPGRTGNRLSVRLTGRTGSLSTLAVAIGFALLGNGLGSRAWALTLAAVALSYGLFGVLRLAYSWTFHLRLVRSPWLSPSSTPSRGAA